MQKNVSAEGFNILIRQCMRELLQNRYFYNVKIP